MSAKGFTLIETLVAIVILMLAISGPLYAAQKALVSSQDAGNRLTAQYLAQEGVEYVRMIRDNAFLANRGLPNASQTAWDAFLNGNNLAQSIGPCRLAENDVNNFSQCALDPSNASQPLSICSSYGNCPQLYLSGSRYVLGTAGTITPYVRAVLFCDSGTVASGLCQIAPTNPNEEIVTVVVSWVAHGVTKSVTYTDSLTPWQ